MQQPGWVAFTAALALVVTTCKGQNENLREKVIRNTLKTRRLPGLDVCGKTILLFDQKIINGKPAELGAYPWMANLGYAVSKRQAPRWLCGGSLITDQYVITAAHCLDPRVIQSPTSPLIVTTVRLGDLDTDDSVNDGASPEEFEVDSVVFHPQYNNERKINDVGLVKMKRKVTFKDLIRPICLPPPEFQTNLFVGYFPIVAGWGKSVTRKGARPPTRLLEAEVEIKETDECRGNITSTSQLRNAVIDHRVICAAAPGTDACQGDSGGPLMFLRKIRKNKQGDSGNFFLMGIVSYGYGCALEGYPGVYTRVTEYMSWIIDNLDI